MFMPTGKHMNINFILLKTASNLKLNAGSYSEHSPLANLYYLLLIFSFISLYYSYFLFFILFYFTFYLLSVHSDYLQ